MVITSFGGAGLRRWLLTALLITLSGGSALAADEPPQLNWRGSWQAGGLLVAELPAGYQLHWQGASLAVDSQRRVLFGLPRDATDTVVLTLQRSADGRQWPLSYPLTPRSYAISRVDGVPQQTVTPPPERLARIRREAALVAAARARSINQPFYASGFSVPAAGRISGVYGSQRVYNGVAGRPHYGVDYAAGHGAAVVAPAAGVVVLAEPDLFYSGGTVIVDHGYGLFSSFLHMSALAVVVGDQLAAGDAIGKVGASGRATGPHLDWRMNWGAVRIDPQLVLQALPALAN